MDTEMINIDGMMCGHCKANVEKSIGDVAGVIEVKVDLEAKKATVTLDPSATNLDEIKAAVKDAGYKVVV